MTTDKAFAATVQREHATYWLQTTGDPERVATVITGEQSAKTFTRLPYETEMSAAPPSSRSRWRAGR